MIKKKFKKYYFTNYKDRYNTIIWCIEKKNYKKIYNINKIKKNDILFLNGEQKKKFKNVSNFGIYINYIPNQEYLCNKEHLSKLLIDKEYYMKTFIDKCDKKLEGLWIEKPISNSCGKGINIIKDPVYWNNSKCILQKYIENPHLINNKKWDIRILVGVNGIGEYYFNPNGIIRSCHEDYLLINKTKDFKNIFSQLTNVSIQIQKYPTLPYNNRLENFELYDIIKKEIDFIIKDVLKTFFIKYNKTNKYNFNLFGFDFIFDNKKIILLEINSTPQMRENINILNKISHKDISYYMFNNIINYINFFFN